MKTAIYLEVEPETKEKIDSLARKERRTIKALILNLIDKKISGVENGRK